METLRTWTTPHLPLALLLVLVLAACSEDGPTDADTTVGESGAAGFADGEAWFNVDESGGTVTLLAGADPARQEEVTVPIVADATWTIDGASHEFVIFNIGVDQCPVPDSGDADDIPGFRGVGQDPDGRPLNLNAGAPTLAINTTYEADWRSTTTAHDWFSPPWVIADGEMRAEEDTVTVVDTGDKVTGTIVVTCR